MAGASTGEALFLEYGSIHPLEIREASGQFLIASLVNGAIDGTEPAPVLSVLGNPGFPLYLGRQDKKINYGSATPHNAGASNAKYYYFSGGWIFSEEDIGKSISVWISTEPPPY